MSSMQLRSLSSSLEVTDRSEYTAALEISVSFYRFLFDLEEILLHKKHREIINREILSPLYLLFSDNNFY